MWVQDLSEQLCYSKIGRKGLGRWLSSSEHWQLLGKGEDYEDLSFGEHQIILDLFTLSSSLRIKWFARPPKSNGWFSRRSRFDSQHLQSSSQLSVTGSSEAF